MSCYAGTVDARTLLLDVKKFAEHCSGKGTGIQFKSDLKGIRLKIPLKPADRKTECPAFLFQPRGFQAIPEQVHVGQNLLFQP